MTDLRLRVVRAQPLDTARDVVRIHKKHRPGIGRHDIVRLSADGGSCYVTVLGTDSEDMIEMDLDTRLDLGVMFDEVHEFSIVEAGIFGQIRWYLDSRNPSVRVPAWLALWSVLLGAAGTGFGLLGFLLALTN